MYDPAGAADAGLIKSIDMSFPFQFDDVIGSDHVRGMYHGVNVELMTERALACRQVPMMSSIP